VKLNEIQLKLKHGQIITGCWERKSYTIIRLIGRGGSGVVYLVKDLKGKPWAMKISSDVAGITHEHRILRFLHNCRAIKDLSSVPKVMELDDFRMGSQVYHYMITQYCRGANLGRNPGGVSLYHAAVIGRQVAQFLSCLHEQGFVFGDLKPGNLIYDFKSDTVYIVDFGSVTMKGQVIKQYTPGYDRLSWGAGGRTADERYDIFALGLLLTTLILGKSSRMNQTDLPSLIAKASEGIYNPVLKNTIASILKQENTDTCTVVKNLSLIIEEELSGRSKATAWFVRFVGAASAAAFILSLAYYYQ
jgi:serine/threonine-protein kinase